MNEEEGELRPQIADRLGLEVEVEALTDPESRAEIVRRREGFSADPAAFRVQWADDQDELAERIAAAEARLPGVRLADDLYGAVGQVVVRSGVESHRADITIVECAKAVAALQGRDEANADDVLAAAELALGHRLAVDPFGPAPRVEPQVLRRLLEEALEAEVTPKKAAGQAR
jgi:magnesium chelatase subunit D